MLEKEYNELLRIVTRHLRTKKIREKGYDRINADEIRMSLGLPSLQQMLEKKRLLFGASVGVKVPGRKVGTVMEEERAENGQWWKMIEKDMEKYDFSSYDELKTSFAQKQLRKRWESLCAKEDQEAKKAFSDALPGN